MSLVAGIHDTDLSSDAAPGDVFARLIETLSSVLFKRPREACGELIGVAMGVA
jgi:ABC-type microcin C transport system permease subunit YejE